MASRKASEKADATPRQRLSAVIKRARDIMRTDPGLNGDLDRVPQLAWLMFLKAFDDLEERRAILEPDYRPILSEGYRWRDWAGNPRLTGGSLLDFVNDDLLPELRELRSRGARRDLADVLGDVFSGVENRMRSGYQLRELLNLLGEVHFTSSDDIHTMAYLYETMLREVRDAAGDSGEFYTPRPVIRFMVNQVDPRLGEVVLDPACGTGGFLVETLEHLRPAADSVSKQAELHASLRGFEKKPMAYLFAVMNCVLHEITVPRVAMANALSVLQADTSRASRVDVVLTNPPFGGAESEDVVGAFPAAYRTAETAWLFLTTVIDKLKPGGRCGIVVPNGVLFGGGVGARVKERLLAECDLHTVVRLPDGVFAPYTSIPTNLLFFEKGRRTEEIWYYEVSPPEGRKRYSKTKPMRYEEFAGCQEWWGGPDRSGRVEGEHAWRVRAGEVRENGFNLDLRNPHGPDDLAHRPPEELVKELIATEEEILGLLNELQQTLEGS